MIIRKWLCLLKLLCPEPAIGITHTHPSGDRGSASQVKNSAAYATLDSVIVSGYYRISRYAIVGNEP